MTTKVIALNIKPGIQRDGTLFDSPVFVDGKWMRFQRGRPRKIGGYRGIFQNGSGISRGMTMSSTGGINYVISGYSAGLQQWQTDNDDGTGSGPYNYSLTNFTSSLNNLWQFDIAYDSTGNSANNLAAHPGQNLTAIDSTTNTPVLYGQFPSNSGTLSMSKVGVFTATGSLSGTTIYINGVYSTIGINQTVSGTGITTGTTITNVVTSTAASFLGYMLGTTLTVTSLTSGSIVIGQTISGPSGGPSVTSGTVITANGTGTGGVGTYTINNSQTVGGTTNLITFGGTGTTTVTTSASMTTGSSITVTFDNNISVSGGCVVLHPYLFVYGNNGLIQNSSAGNFADWVSADANSNNVSTGKIVKGLPLRGGTTSPAGLFWSLDSLIRVTYAPQTVGTSTLYWRYDIISSQTSIMSSQSVIEYDGIYYWLGVDRFLMYNGVVQELDNQLNMNYFFDNVNYAQRQKVWCTKVPRWGEIWWFYPKGDATECTDAIIYNVRDKTWYDAGEALGARRSAGTFSEVFRQPLWGGWEVNAAGKYIIWQHETGTDEINLVNVNAVQSYFETNSLGWITGGPGVKQLENPNRWIRLERIEPDFVQAGDMNIYVTGKSYAQDTTETTTEYTFAPDTPKVDMREQRREMRLRFESNTLNGNYETGQIMLSADIGDERGTGNP